MGAPESFSEEHNRIGARDRFIVRATFERVVNFFDRRIRALVLELNLNA